MSLLAAIPAICGAVAALKIANRVSEAGKSVKILPTNLKESMVMNAAKSGYGKDISGVLKGGKQSDPNFSYEAGWRKMHTAGDKSPNSSSVIVHWWFNVHTGEKTGFKFK